MASYRFRRYACFILQIMIVLALAELRQHATAQGNVPSQLSDEALAHLMIQFSPQTLDDDAFFATYATKLLCQEALSFFGGEFKAPRTLTEFRNAMRGQVIARAKATPRVFSGQAGGTIGTYEYNNQRFPIRTGFYSMQPKELTLEVDRRSNPQCTVPGIPRFRTMFARFWHIRLDRDINPLYVSMDPQSAQRLVERPGGRGVDIVLEFEITAFDEAGGQPHRPEVTFSGRVRSIRFYNQIERSRDPRARPLFELREPSLWEGPARRQ